MNVDTKAQEGTPRDLGGHLAITSPLVVTIPYADWKQVASVTHSLLHMVGTPAIGIGAPLGLDLEIRLYATVTNNSQRA